MKKDNIKKSDEKQNVENKDLIVTKEKKNRIGLGKLLRQTSLTVLLILIIIAVCLGLNIFCRKG